MRDDAAHRIEFCVASPEAGYRFAGRFRAMASPCEVLIDSGNETAAHQAVAMAANEAWRIERAFSRYRNDNLIARINTAGGGAVAVDDETARLLDFADHCHRLSDGLFDITAGVLRRVWQYGPEAKVPTAQAVAEVLPLVGWQHVRWRNAGDAVIQMPAGMQIDLGGIAKEYAVDRVLMQLDERLEAPVLVNFGGDLRANRAPSGREGWHVGIEAWASRGDDSPQAARNIVLAHGACATSGDKHRHLVHEGQRYGHILDPRTGWPVPDAPLSATVLGPTCTDAGLLSTLAMLMGAQAEAFLAEQDVAHWVMR